LLVTLLLILLAQLDYLAKSLHVEAVALGFKINLFFGFGEFFDLLFKCSIRSTIARSWSPAIPTGPLMVYSWST
jgi:hypothetical protein